MKTLVTSPEIIYLNIEEWRADFFPNLHRSMIEEDSALSLTKDLKKAIARSADTKHRKIDRTAKDAAMV